ncbi:MAG: universal stress protein [Deltaproteobacteria bacterium]|nr:universal stress protein [Deltaproteobacteria bacterium]
MKFEHVLVPIDFSEQSRRALRAADELCQSYNATLTLLHVHAIVGVAVLDFTYVEQPQEIVRITEAAEEQLQSLVAELQTPKDSIKIEVLTGDPVDEMIKLSQEHDLMVMSTHGRSGITRFLMGSVVERVVRGAHCSVLVIRPESQI